MTTQAVSGRRYFTKAWLLEQKSLIALLVLIAIVSTLSPNFFTVNNLFNILQQTSVNAIMAVGMTLVILTSGIDLSVGSLLALTGAVAASIVGVEVNALVAVAAALALGAAIGAVTGVIVAKGRVQAFIATLVMMLLLRGVTMVYTDGSPVNTGFTDNADLFGWFGIGRPLGVPTPVWIMAIVFIAAWYMLHHTRLGRYIYALDKTPARLRLEGYRAAMKRAGLAIPQGYEITGDFEFGGGFDAMQALLAHQQRPQAVFTGNDAMAVGAYQALYQAGLRIPQDMAVIGYDDIELARYMTPPLTTIHQPKDELGELAIDVLIHRMAQPALQQQRLQLTPVLTVRGSV
ncbi:substrate-binding domain-containing protein [Salmonella enterica subsp. enterica serovar Java]|uniref:substrate-binding domain-containing protein n=1 Tax=Salmonella enterica TaxID=28901 RepID=UPI0022B9E002|nr:substrate-binding domain-containing protein [Salmonella enterica]MCZ9324744.1 substrate-binding domain-containing protein [Salmonella enterica subsp. enterica serovar Java]